MPIAVRNRPVPSPSLILAMMLAGCSAPSGESTAAPPEPSPPALTRFRGHVAIGHEVRSFRECGTERESWVFDLTKGDLAEAYGRLTALPYQPLFVEVVGVRRPAPNRGFAGDFGEAITVVELRRAEREGFGCDEELDGFVFRALGNEPSWRLDVRKFELVLSSVDLGQITFSSPTIDRPDGETTIIKSSDDGELEARLVERRCIDSMSGSYYPFSATVRFGESLFEGCAAEGMGAGP